MNEALRSLDNGRYQLQEILGQGGMAIVYKAWDERLRIERAIKILSPQVARRASLRKRFENEARTMARLAHPNIVSVTDVVEEGSHFFMVMELVTGGTLWDWVTKHGRMPSRLALEYLRPVLDAMGAAHAAGVIHRDIKPQNIMITAQGKPKVTDFGIAHVQDHFNTGNLTRTGSVMGTWGYMAPEQRQSARDVDGRSDVYALGATLYAIVTADLPVDLFAAAQDEDVLERVPPELHSLVRKATRYRAGNRFQDVGEMAEACDKLLRELPDLPADTPRLGCEPEPQSSPPPQAAGPRYSATLGMEQAADPPVRDTPIPLRTASQSEETFDFGMDSELDGSLAEEPEAPEPDANATPLFPPRHTAVPDITSSEAQGDTAPEPAKAPRWRLPLVALLALGIGVPGAWYGLRGQAPPREEGPAEPLLSPDPDPSDALVIPEPEAPTPGPAPAEEPEAEEQEPEQEPVAAEGASESPVPSPLPPAPSPHRNRSPSPPWQSWPPNQSQSQNPRPQPWPPSPPAESSTSCASSTAAARPGPQASSPLAATPSRLCFRACPPRSSPASSISPPARATP
jgi:serine/threonine protein kinase